MYNIPKDLINKYAVIGPRYTSYPTAPIWKPIDRQKQLEWFFSVKNSHRPLSLYFHVPFCHQRCYYCGCNAFVTKHQSQSAKYVKYLTNELHQLKKQLPDRRKIRQLHFGGGTPNFLLNEEFDKILEAISSLYEFEPDAEIAIEIDPCSTRPGQLEFLRNLGFNRISLGVQDFDETVQKAINRLQSREITFDHLKEVRELGFEGINFDLIYGLPHQTVESFSKTLEAVVEMHPDRLAVYNFGYLPDRMPHQRKIDPLALPDSQTKLQLLFESIRQLTDSGYDYIGMDHFSLPTDELSIAMRNRTLHRNFMGYTPKSGVDLFGIGMTAISEFGNYFLQNEKTIRTYQSQIDATGLAGSKGLELNQDDQIRKWVILRLICHFYLSFSEFESAFMITFWDYFDSLKKQLELLQEDELIEITDEYIAVLDNGKILVRNICMVFDAYIHNDSIPKVKYSKTI